MTRAVMEKKDDLFEAMVEFGRSAELSGPTWLKERRAAALKRFEDLGLPTKRDESWRFTDTKVLKKTPFVPAVADASPGVDLSDLSFSTFGEDRLVFLNGHFAEELSSKNLPKGIRVRSLATALQQDADGLEPILGRYATSEHEAFNSLNLALFQDGAVIEVDPGCVVESPIHLLFVNRAADGPLLINTRVLAVCGDNSQVSLVESHLGLPGHPYLSNGVTEVLAGDNAVVDHYKVQQENSDAFHIATFQSHQGRNANVRTMTVTLSGAVVRNETNAVLGGEGGWAELNGLFLVGEDHHVDNFTRIEHAKPHCDSREVYRGILSEQGSGVFRGRIVVAKDAQKTDSKQTNNNLLLSDEALINTKPQLEIYADDVKCTHGATIGQLEKEAIFYLRSRGISESAARSMLIYAFATDVVGRIKVESLREELDRYLFSWLPKGEVVREAF